MKRAGVAAVGRPGRRRALSAAHRCSIGLRSGSRAAITSVRSPLPHGSAGNSTRGKYASTTSVVQGPSKVSGAIKLPALAGGEEAGAPTAQARHVLLEPLISGSATSGAIQPVIHAAFVEIKHAAGRQFCHLAPEEPALHRVPLPVFYEFFLA